MNIKHCYKLAIIIFIILILLYNSINLNKYFTYSQNNQLYKILDLMPEYEISINNIPNELKSHLVIYNISNIKEIDKMNNKTKSETVLSILASNNKTINNLYNRLHIFDTLSFTGSYFPSIHTDIEWNKIQNDGFQVWCLVENYNKNNIGNMYILYNDYLYNKYKDIGINLRIYNNKIAVTKNCYNKEMFQFIKPKNILEYMSINTFMQTTKKFYLNFKEGDCIVLNKNIIHMSDYRTSSNLRKAFNFRVAIKTNNKLKLSNEKCGYVHNINNTNNKPYFFF